MMPGDLEVAERHNHVPAKDAPSRCHYCHQPSSAHVYEWDSADRSRRLTDEEIAARAVALGDRR